MQTRFYYSLSAALLLSCVVFLGGCGKKAGVEPEVEREVLQDLLAYYEEKDKEIVAELLEFTPGKDEGNVIVIARLSWPKFAALGKKVSVRLRKEGDTWEVLEEKDL